MNLERMLEKCHRGQWSVDDLDWSRPPRPMSRTDEVAIVQYFTDMAGIEKMAGELFDLQRQRTDDPTLRAIFATFVADEQRHSCVAQRLAEHYDVHRYRRYAPNRHLKTFHPHFVNALRFFSPEVANAYITSGELILDVALLRSINDFVDDEMSQSAMRLINRDESRHIAIDYYMTDYYCSEEYDRKLASQPPHSWRHELYSVWTLVQLLVSGAPFFREVFFAPMEVVDPAGKRMLQAWKQIQLVSTKARVSERPFVRFMLTVQRIFNHPILGVVFGRLALRVAGVEPHVLKILYTDAERRRAAEMSLEQMADEALNEKYAH